MSKVLETQQTKQTPAFIQLLEHKEYAKVLYSSPPKMELQTFYSIVVKDYDSQVVLNVERIRAYEDAVICFNQVIKDYQLPVATVLRAVSFHQPSKN